MNIKDLSKKSLDFTIKRVAEIIGLFLIFISVLFFIALLSYSPEDPNFIFTNNEDIKNILGFRGSYISDFFFQSIGLISFLISFTIFFTGINLIRNKNYLIIVENIFYLILYSIIGSIFLTTFYSNSFWLYVNGNGGFVGNFFKDTFLTNILNLNRDISFYILLTLTIIIFFISINLSIKYLFDFFKNILKRINKSRNVKSEFMFDTIALASKILKIAVPSEPIGLKIVCAQPIKASDGDLLILCSTYGSTRGIAYKS